MSKPLKAIGQVAGVLAVVLAPINPVLATISAAVSAVATTGAAALQKPPKVQGTVSEVMIGANMPVPYIMGRTYVGGHKVYDDSTGGPDNWERTQIFVGTHGGPIEGFEKFLADFTQITIPISGGRLQGHASGFYATYLTLNSRLGLRPDTAVDATGGRNAFRGWGSNHKLSGMACWSVTMEFDEKGKRWASGIPAFGVVAKWVKTYDPRKDTTYPGGSGSQRWNDESTWAYGSAGTGTVAQGENPALHALAYARGRFMGSGSVKVVGCGLAEEAIDFAAFVELANVCDANGWTLGGAVYEGPGVSRWDNLKRILDAAAAEPVWVGGKLSVSISAPKTALDTITRDDIADGEVVIPAMKEWKSKFNTIVYRYRSESHRWEYVQGEAVSNATYVTEDGETKTDERQYDLIQNVNQGAQRAAYALANEREFGPIRLPLKPRMRLYLPGEALNIDLADITGDPGLGTIKGVIRSRSLDPVTSSVVLELDSETDDKHAWALGQTGTEPPTPTILSPEEIDETIGDTVARTSISGPTVETFKFGHTGTAEAGEFPRNLAYRLLLPDGSQITSGVTWTYEVEAGTANGFTSVDGQQSMSGTGTGSLSVTSLGSDEAQVLVRGKSGAVTATHTTKLRKQYASAPVSGGGGDGTTIASKSSGFALINSTSFTTIASLTGTMPTGKTDADLSAVLQFMPDTTGGLGNWTIELKWQIDVSGTWTDVGSVVADDSHVFIIEPDGPVYQGDPAEITNNQQSTGLTAGNTYDWRLVARNLSGTRTHYVTGQASITA